MSYPESEPIEATVAELKPRMRNLTIAFKVIEKGEIREVTSRKDGEQHRVADIRVGDSTGTVLVPMWDDAIDQVEVEKTYNLANGYTTLFQGFLRLNVGRYGELSDAEEAIQEINLEVDMSAEEHEREYRPRRGYGGGRGGYGGGGGGGGGYGRRDDRGGGYRRGGRGGGRGRGRY